MLSFTSTSTVGPESLSPAANGGLIDRQGHGAFLRLTQLKPYFRVLECVCVCVSTESVATGGEERRTLDKWK